MLSFVALATAAQGTLSPTEALVGSFASWYTPAVLLAALALGLGGLLSCGTSTGGGVDGGGDGGGDGAGAVPSANLTATWC